MNATHKAIARIINDIAEYGDNGYFILPKRDFCKALADLFEREDKDKLMKSFIKELRARQIIDEDAYKNMFGALSWDEVRNKIFGSFERKQFLKACGVEEWYRN